MKIKKEYIALVVVITGLSLYLVLRSPDGARYELPEVPAIAKKDISKIEIAGFDNFILLNKADDKWHLGPEGYLANSDKVDNMLNIINELTMTALVSESKNYSRYGLDEDSKVTVKAWIGDKLVREFEVGKVATSYRHTFVRLAGDDRVYHAKGNFRNDFDQTAEALRDKTVLSFDQSVISEIQIMKGTEQLKKLLRIVSNLQCETYINDLKKEDLADPLYTVRCKGAQDYTLSIFAKREKEAKNYPAVSSGSVYPFLLPEWQVASLMKMPDEIFKKSEHS